MDKVVHFEIPAKDLERAKKFYSSVFGWQLEQMGPEMGNYVMARTAEVGEDRMPRERGAINGGIMLKMRPVKATALTINVENIDEAVRKVKANGGKLSRKKMKVGEMGMLAYVKDSEGNVTGLWQNLPKK